MIERIAETDEDLTFKFLEAEEISEDELRSALRAATIANKLVPVFCGTSLRTKGVQQLLDAVVDYLPSPLDIPSVRATNPDDRAGRTPASRSHGAGRRAGFQDSDRSVYRPAFVCPGLLRRPPDRADGAEQQP